MWKIANDDGENDTIDSSQQLLTNKWILTKATNEGRASCRAERVDRQYWVQFIKHNDNLVELVWNNLKMVF